MWLINVEALRLEEFTDPYNMPEYAILSHTWADEEVSHHQFNHPRRNLRSTKGYRKIKACCSEVRHWGLRYVWIDTCCIDKKSSAELSEAINSMFKWYAEATICIAYLSDVDSWHRDVSDLERQLSRSRYYQRGWTLQELIAPNKVDFYDKYWNRIGTKESMSRQLEQITGIESDAFLHVKRLSSYPIACRMSWAASRRTMRIEDIAYCLLGIFDINMPLLYGEGANAFRRLQEEIIKESDDQTIFAWEHDMAESNWEQARGVFAQHPVQFKNSATFIPAHLGGGAYNITNKGLSITLPLIRGVPSRGQYECIAVLDCYGPPNRLQGRKSLVAISLTELIANEDRTYGHSEKLVWRSISVLHLIDAEDLRNAEYTSLYLLK
ncbi:hypothetical protein H2200_008451 [Cladophialophora chaetospira]|uniref:HET-domain-containing protein n=1 Tax=Cladophialophora chaetospira TaxID=386627 RepID=A0AA38X5S9_9EURO|nr:hypothetical protein H2200_008451 [Cladophialophora chaetospira]